MSRDVQENLHCATIESMGRRNVKYFCKNFPVMTYSNGGDPPAELDESSEPLLSYFQKVQSEINGRMGATAYSVTALSGRL